MGNGGSYPSTPKVELLNDGRIVRLLEDFFYFDPKGTQWMSPKGAKADGASIPKPLWSLVGGPFEGKYRDAAIIHDFYCSKRHEPWKQVHRMFFDAMITSGVGNNKAKLMYAGVYFGGPRWSQMDVDNATLVFKNRERRVRMCRKEVGSKRIEGRFAIHLHQLNVRGQASVSKKPVPYRYVMSDEDLEKLQGTVGRRGADLDSIDQQIDEMLAGRKKTRGKSSNR